MSLPDILQHLNLMRASSSIRLTQLVTVFLSVSLTAAGFVHLFENTGDPWRNFSNARREPVSYDIDVIVDSTTQLPYWECIYLLVVTMGTVGYGDVVARTTLGRVFMMFFILGGLVRKMSKNVLCKVCRRCSRRTYRKSLISSRNGRNTRANIVKRCAEREVQQQKPLRQAGKKHIVVMGHITSESVGNFLKDFLHEDREDVDVQVIFLHR